MIVDCCANVPMVNSGLFFSRSPPPCEYRMFVSGDNTRLPARAYHGMHAGLDAGTRRTLSTDGPVASTAVSVRDAVLRLVSR